MLESSLLYSDVKGAIASEVGMSSMEVMVAYKFEVDTVWVVMVAEKFGCDTVVQVKMAERF